MSNPNGLFINFPNWREYSLAFATIVYEVVDRDGDALQCSTFVTGKIADEAIAAWATKHRKRKIVSTTVVTHGLHKPLPVVRDRWGPKIEVADPLLTEMARAEA